MPQEIKGIPVPEIQTGDKNQAVPKPSPADSDKNQAAPKPDMKRAFPGGINWPDKSQNYSIRDVAPADKK
jgi:hypothetical protein